MASLFAKVLRYHKDVNVEKVIETMGGNTELQQVSLIKILTYRKFCMNIVDCIIFQNYRWTKQCECLLVQLG